MPIAPVPPVPPEKLAMVRSDLPRADWNHVGTDHSHGRRAVPLAAPAARVPARQRDFSPSVGTA